MKCKASATQEARPINQIGDPPSSAPQSHSPVQTVLQRSQQVFIRGRGGFRDDYLSRLFVVMQARSCASRSV
ncbi:MAG: hypothetical protein ORN21_06075 [Methylophilaceae bacterium]|nr:hypothetical protein [Methylophilaceae bacterium]